MFFSIINSRLFCVFFFITVFPFWFFFSVYLMVDSLSPAMFLNVDTPESIGVISVEGEQIKQLEMLKNIELKFESIKPGRWGKNQNLIFKLNNNTKHPIHQLKIRTVYFNKDDQVLDIYNTSYSDIGVFYPNEDQYIDISYDSKREFDGEEIDIGKAEYGQARVIDFKIAE